MGSISSSLVVAFCGGDAWCGRGRGWASGSKEHASRGTAPSERAFVFATVTSEVDTVIQAFSKVALAKGLRLNYIGPDSSAAPFVVRGDPTRLRQIIVNLVENAIKFTEAGEIEIAVRAPEHNHDRRWQFAVRDTGVGIEVTARKKLFEPFMQADQPMTRNFGGTGLRLVEAMGGEIDVQSIAGTGSTFWFALPLSKGDAAVIERRRQPKPDPFARTRRPLSILVAEDNEVIQVHVGKMLERMGHRAVCVGGYALVLMDMHMPVINGTEATRCIRQLDGDASTIPVIALTADAMLDRLRGRHRRVAHKTDQPWTAACEPRPDRYSC
ncbi:hypothetical protein PMIN03_012133 [Paraphaeosphaeria minitans]